MAWQADGGVASHKEAQGETFVGHCAHSRINFF
jgi:hypothetical protein